MSDIYICLKCKKEFKEQDMAHVSIREYGASIWSEPVSPCCLDYYTDKEN